MCPLAPAQPSFRAQRGISLRFQLRHEVRLSPPILYILYFLACVDLALKCRWSVKGTILVLLAGMVPFLSFFVERRVTHKVQQGIAL